MILILLTALILLAVALTLGLRVLGSRVQQEQHKVGRIAAYGYTPPRTGPAEPVSLRSRLDALANAVGGFIDRRLDNRRERELRRELYAAGWYRTTPRRFLGYRLLITVGLIGVWLWFGAATHANAAGTILVSVILGACGWILPMFFLKRSATDRLQRIDHEIPELVDLLVTAIEGGMGFGGALQLVANSLEGPLGDEIRIALQEQNIGLTTSEALRNMASRIDTLSMQSFIQAVNQGESLGVSIGKIMRDLASEMRNRRRAAAEERAHKAGTKIIFPVALCIFPAIFVVALGPPLIYIFHSFGGNFG
jgi:tight adherence protein C